MSHHINRILENTFVLPFATSAQNRVKAFTKEMEMAAILYLAESNREKGEGVLLKKPDEKLVFITEAHYPIWLVPHDGGTLLFDGLGLSKHAISYDAPPDITAFINDIKTSARTKEAYSVALARNLNYFQNTTGKEEKTIEHLITSQEFKQDFAAYFSNSQGAKPSPGKALLMPTVNEVEISASMEQLSDLKTKINDDVTNLDTSMKLLNAKTLKQVQEIREAIRRVSMQFDRQIDHVKPSVTKDIRRIQKNFDKRISRTSKRIQKQLELLYKKQAGLERTRKHLLVDVKRCEARINSSRHRKNKQSENQWTNRQKRIKKKLPTIEKNINETHKKIGNLEAAEKLKVSELRVDCDVRIGEAQKILRVLESSREAEFTMMKQEIAALENNTSHIISQMNEMAKSKKAALNQFDDLSVPRRKHTVSLVYMPFYLVRYEMETTKRYALYPPSIVGDMDLMTKMRGVLGAARMKAFLQPRSKAIAAFLDQFITLIQRNPMFEKEVTDAGIEDSVLRIKQLRIGVKRGLKELENEEWMSPNELQTIAKLLYIYA
jgi:hypothetical protein